MDEKTMTAYRKLLEEKRSKLSAALLQSDETTKPVAPDRAIGRLTRQEAIQSQQMALELQRRNKLHIQQIEGALQRIDNGTFGICVRCEEKIGERRLTARPETPLCLHCADLR